jgi:hypothetical protein
MLEVELRDIRVEKFDDLRQFHFINVSSPYLNRLRIQLKSCDQSILLLMQFVNYSAPNIAAPMEKIPGPLPKSATFIPDRSSKF